MFAAGAIFVSVAGAAAGDLLSELGGSELDEFHRNGETVVLVHRSEWVWPEVRVYKKIQAGSAEIAKLFLDYESAGSFVAGLESVLIKNSPEPGVVDVNYVVRLPFVGRTEYIARNTHTQTGDFHSVRWTMLKPPPFASGSDGELRIQPLGGGSVICYANRITPAVKFAGALRGFAARETVGTVRAFAAEAERRCGGANAPKR